MSRIASVITSIIIFIGLSQLGCSKGGSGSQSTNSVAQSEEAKKNAQLEQTNPLAAPTIRGDAERIYYAVVDSLDSYHQKNWENVLANLKSARQQTDKALENLPTGKKATMVRLMLEDMNASIDRAIQATENRSKDLEAQLVQLRTKTMSLKISVPTTPTS